MHLALALTTRAVSAKKPIDLFRGIFTRLQPYIVITEMIPVLLLVDIILGSDYVDEHCGLFQHSIWCQSFLL